MDSCSKRRLAGRPDMRARWERNKHDASFGKYATIDRLPCRAVEPTARTRHRYSGHVHLGSVLLARCSLLAWYCNPQFHMGREGGGETLFSFGFSTGIWFLRTFPLPEELVVRRESDHGRHGRQRGNEWNCSCKGRRREVAARSI